MKKLQALALKRELDLTAEIVKKDSWQRNTGILTRIDYIDVDKNDASALMHNGEVIAVWNGRQDGWTWKSKNYKTMTA
jgi:hypothetical protein